MKEKRAQHLSKENARGNRLTFLGTALFYLGYGLYTFILLLDNSTLNEDALFLIVDNAFKLVPLVMLSAASILALYHSPRTTIYSIITLLAGLLSYLFSEDGAFFWLTLCFAACRGAKLRDLACVNLLSTCIATSVVLALWLGGQIPQAIDLNNEAIRYSLGFSTPNRCANTLLAIFIAYGILSIKKGSMRSTYLMGALLMCSSYLITHSRTTVVMFAVSALAFAFFRSIDRLSLEWKKACSFVALIIVGLCIGTSIIMAYTYTPDNSLLSSINDALSQRLSYARMYTERYSVPLFGRDFSDAPVEFGNGRQGTHFLVDNAYVHVLLRFGIVPFAIYVIAILTPMLQSALRGKWEATTLGLLIMAIFGVSETNAIYAETNYFLISGVSMIISGESCNYLNEDCNEGNRMKILFCYGEYAGVKCGVVDYTRRLLTQLYKTGQVKPVIAYQYDNQPENRSAASREFDSIQIKSWKSPLSMIGLAFQARKLKCTVIHIQYPTVGYGRGAAFLLAIVVAKLLGIKVVYTSHEYSIYSWKGRAKEMLCMLLSNEIIAVDINEFMIVGQHGRIRKKLQHIPIAPSLPKAEITNIQRAAIRNEILDAQHEIAAGYFGFINESKYFLELIGAFAILKEKGQLTSKLVIIGELSPKIAYQDKVIEKIHELKIEDDILVTGYLEAQKASNCIACCDFMLLPTSHGASERNSSFLACYQNGVPIVTSKPKGAFSYQGVSYFQSNEAESFAKAILTMQERGGTKGASEVPSWEAISIKHLKTYRAALHN